MFVPKAENVPEFMQYVPFLSRRKDIVVSCPTQAHSRVVHSSCPPIRYEGGIGIRAKERDADNGG